MFEGTSDKYEFTIYVIFGSILALLPLGPTTLREMPVVLPHDVLNALHECGRLRQLYTDEDLCYFWGNFKQHESSVVQWPAQAQRGMIPIGIHGDDFRYTEHGQKLVLVSMNVLIDSEMQDRFPLFAVRCAASLHWYVNMYKCPYSI